MLENQHKFGIQKLLHFSGQSTTAITCPDMSVELKEVGQRGVQFQSIVDARNKRVTQFFCGDNTNQLEIKVRIGLRDAKHKLVTANFCTISCEAIVLK